jgi:uncharacterized protein YndB with AHSA1/START domain
MPEVRVQAEIAAPIDVVWSVYTDYTGWTEWAGVREVVLRRRGEPAPNGIGASCVLRARGVAIEEEIIGFEPPRRLRYRLVAGLPFRSHEAEVLLSEVGENTRLSWQVRFEPRVIGTGGLMARLLKSELEQILERLVTYPFEKRLAQAPPAPDDAPVRSLRR